MPAKQQPKNCTALPTVSVGPSREVIFHPTSPHLTWVPQKQVVVVFWHPHPVVLARLNRELVFHFLPGGSRQHWLQVVQVDQTGSWLSIFHPAEAGSSALRSLLGYCQWGPVAKWTSTSLGSNKKPASAKKG